MATKKPMISGLALAAAAAGIGEGAWLGGIVKAARHRPRMPMTLSVVSTDWVRAPSRTPSQLTNVSSTIAAAPTSYSVPLGQPMTWQK